MYFWTHGLRNAWLHKWLKKTRFRGPFHKEHGKWGKTLLKAEPQHRYHIYWSLWRQFRLKKSLWVICKIFGLFVNPLCADNNYSLLNTGNLLQHFQIQLSHKQKIFPEFFFTFSKFRFNFDIFEKNGEPHRWCIIEFTDSEIRR